MIGRLRGTLVYKQPPALMIDVQGVGYELEASLTTFQGLPVTGEELTLYTHLLVREDAHALYGFATTDERALFRSLIKVSGIGAKLALLILSGMSVAEFGRCVQDGNAAALVRLPGIGKKTAERLVIEMRDRIASPGVELPAAILPLEEPMAVNPIEEAVGALIALGYKPPEASPMIQRIGDDTLTSEQLIRAALQAAVRRT